MFYFYYENKLKALTKLLIIIATTNILNQTVIHCGINQENSSFSINERQYLKTGGVWNAFINNKL